MAVLIYATLHKSQGSQFTKLMKIPLLLFDCPVYDQNVDMLCLGCVLPNYSGKTGTFV